MKKAKKHPGRKAPAGHGRDIAERIIASAIKLFGRTSHYYVSLREISVDAGVTLSLTIYYFKNKENLYRIAFERNMRRLDDCFKKIDRSMDRRPEMCGKDAAGLFLDCIGTTFDAVYGGKNNGNSFGKMLLYELAYPTPYHDVFLEKYFKPHFESIAGLIMKVNRTLSYEAAFRLGTTIMGEMFSFMIQRELVAKTLKIDAIGPKETNRFRKMILEHSANMIRHAK